MVQREKTFGSWRFKAKYLKAQGEGREKMDEKKTKSIRNMRDLRAYCKDLYRPSS
jgi:hypothetical protein